MPAANLILETMNNSDGVCQKFRCVCGAIVYTTDYWLHSNIVNGKFNFCPNCGIQINLKEKK